MKSYKLTYLISPEISEKELIDLRENIVSEIERENGILIESSFEKKRYLAYPIKKNKTAFVSSLSFRLLPEKLGSLEKKLKAEESILRYLILTSPKTKKPPTTFREKGGLGKPPTLRKKAAGGKVELKEIDKKLEEILNAD